MAREKEMLPIQTIIPLTSLRLYAARGLYKRLKKTDNAGILFPFVVDVEPLGVGEDNGLIGHGGKFNFDMLTYEKKEVGSLGDIVVKVMIYDCWEMMERRTIIRG